MRTTIVPAQITTVEDKIAGNLSLSQLLILSAPIFVGSAIYIGLPPVLHFALYKIVVTVAFLLICSLMSIRVKGKILLIWAIIISRYNLRPRYYIANKNDMHNRELASATNLEDEEEQKVETKKKPNILAPVLSTREVAQIEQIISNPHANLTFKPNKKGGIGVLITEIK